MNIRRDAASSFPAASLDFAWSVDSSRSGAEFPSGPVAMLINFSFEQLRIGHGPQR